jgi:hypothetical protein
MTRVSRLSLAALIALALPASMSAHFKLLEPASWITEDQRGDPQKLGPCGGDPKGQNEMILTNAVTKVTGGSKLHLKILETSCRPIRSRSRSTPTAACIRCGRPFKAHRRFR